MKHLILKAAILILLFGALFALASCSSRLSTNSCPSYIGSTVKINSHYKK